MRLRNKISKCVDLGESTHTEHPETAILVSAVEYP